MALQVSKQDLQLVRAHAESAYPNECCGLLLGKIGKIADRDAIAKILVKVWEAENAWGEEVESFYGDFVRTSINSNRSQRQLPVAIAAKTSSERYYIDPKEMLACQRFARDRDLEIIGIYHSHPDCPAIPSQFDRDFAWQHYSYIIVSVENGAATDCRSWMLDRDRCFQPEIIQIDLEQSLNAFR
jgi:proteasome lid subunit RPN8/RPN11